MHRPMLVVISMLCGLALLVGLPGAATAQAPTGEVRVTQVDTSAYPQVTIYVAVTDANGQHRRDMQAMDFKVTEEGTPVTISNVDGGGGPIATALVIDRSGSMKHSNKLDGAQAAARAFVAQMRPDDQTTVIAFEHRSEVLQSLTSDQDKLRQAIGRLEADGNTTLYDGIVAGVDALRAVAGRRVLLVLTDGQDCREIRCQPGPGGDGSRASRPQAIDYANQYEQPVYVVGLGERNDLNPDVGINEAALRQIATGTYGEYFYAPGGAELAALYARLAGNAQQEYALTYVSPRPFYDGTRRDIQVQVGAVASTGQYMERHLINVESNPLVGVLLLLPLLGLLLLPGLLQRRGWLRAQPGTPMAVPVDIEDEGMPGAAGNVPPPVAPAAPRHKRLSPLESSPARSEAGAPVANTGITLGHPVMQLALQDTAQFCQQCGQTLRPGARFCGKCGARV